MEELEDEVVSSSPVVSRESCSLNIVPIFTDCDSPPIYHNMLGTGDTDSLLSVVLCQGMASSQEEDTLCLWRQAHAALVVLGLTSFRNFSRTLAHMFSTSSTTLFLVKLG